MERLCSRRIILASASARRCDILKKIVSSKYLDSDGKFVSILFMLF